MKRIEGFRCLLVLAVLLVAGSATAGQKTMSLDDLFGGLAYIREVAISPDGTRVAYLVTEPKLQGSLMRPTTQLWISDAAGNRSRRLASGQLQGISWAPDGRSLAYIAQAQSGGLRIHVVDPEDASIRVVDSTQSTAQGSEYSVRSFSWSPDGKRFAALSTLGVKNWTETQPPAPAVLIMDVSPELRLGGAAVLGDSFIEVVDARSGESERLSQPPLRAFTGGSGRELDWSRDGRRILFSGFNEVMSNGEKVSQANDTLAATQVFEADADTGRVRELGGAPGWDRYALWNERDGGVWSIGSGDLDPYLPEISIRSLSGGGQESRVVVDDVSGSPELRRVGNDFALLRIVDGSRKLFRIDAQDPKPVLVSPDDKHIRLLSISADGATVAVVMGDANEPAELYVGPLGGGKYTKITHIYDAVLENFALAKAERLVWKSNDGRFDVDGYLLKPANFDPRRKYPLLVNIHGGPGASYLNDFWDLRLDPARHSQMQAYVDRGYLVFMPNPRGGSGYGKEFQEALRGDMTGAVDKDIEPGVDALIRREYVDSARMGIMGASYGGYAAAWAVSQTHRYKAASVNDGVFGLYGTYGYGPAFQQFYQYFIGGNPRSNPTAYMEKSPTFHAPSIKTPVLLRAGNVDGGLLPYSFLVDAVEFYSALKDEHTPVELIVHMYESHGIYGIETSRAYLESNLDWFDYWLDCKVDSDATKRSQYARWDAMRRKSDTAACN